MKEESGKLASVVKERIKERGGDADRDRSAAAGIGRGAGASCCQSG